MKKPQLKNSWQSSSAATEPEPTDLSVVIPVYNGAKTIRRALNSLLAAVRHVSWEVLVLDDGSTDDTAQVVGRYVRKHSFIRLVRRKENRGTGFTRNQSMELARGRYIWFVDADDEVPEKAFDGIDAQLLNQGLDVLLFDYEMKSGRSVSPMIDLDEIIFARLPEGDFTVAQHPEVLISSHFVWNKIFRREFLLANEICFLAATYHEDIPVHIKALCLAARLRKLRGVLLRYYERDFLKGGKQRLLALRAFGENERFLRSFPGLNAAILTAWQVFKANHLVGVYKIADESLLPEIRRYNDEFLKSLPLAELLAFMHNPFLRRDVMRHCSRLHGIHTSD